MKHFEPVVKKSTSYSILFLRDDSKVVSFRLKPFWIKTLAVIFVLFSAASGSSGYAAHYYWKKYQTLQLERSELTEKLGENRRQLGRLAGVEIVKESTLPRSSMAGVNAITATPAGPEGNGKAEGEAPSAPESPGATTHTPDAPAHATTPQTSPTPVSPAEPGAGAQEAGAAQENAEEHPALISEVQIKPGGANTFRLSFDLSNRNQQLTLTGRVSLLVETKSGARHEVSQVNRDALRFIINRYKRVSATFSLPEGVQAESVVRLFLTVSADEQPAITYSFPIPTS